MDQDNQTNYSTRHIEILDSRYDLIKSLDAKHTKDWPTLQIIAFVMKIKKKDGSWELRS